MAKEWEKCSAPCGAGGTQTRKIYCEQIISSGVPSIVDDQQCANLQKPTTEQACNQGVICGEWHFGPWKPVSANIPISFRTIYFFLYKNDTTHKRVMLYVYGTLMMFAFTVITSS